MISDHQPCCPLCRSPLSLLDLVEPPQLSEVSTRSPACCISIAPLDIHASSLLCSEHFLDINPQEEARLLAREAEAEALRAAGGSYGAKVKALIRQLLANRQQGGGPAAGGSDSADPPTAGGRSRPTAAGIKSVVFSQFLGEVQLYLIPGNYLNNICPVQHGKYLSNNGRCRCIFISSTYPFNG